MHMFLETLVNLLGTTVKANDVITFSPYYITPDGMKVYGIETRTYTVNDEITKIQKTDAFKTEKFGNPEEINEQYTNNLNVI